MVHKLKSKSSFIVVVLSSLRHGACVRCGKSIISLDESAQHWEEELSKNGSVNSVDSVAYKEALRA